MVWVKGLAGLIVVAACMLVSLLYWPLEPLLQSQGLDPNIERLMIGLIVGSIAYTATLMIMAARERQRRRAAYEEEARKRRQKKIKKDPAAWTQRDHDDLSRVFDQMKALPKMPRVFEKLKAYWGFPEFLEVADDMLTMEQGREGRQGFDPAIHQEVTALRHFYIENIERIMSPSLTEDEKNRIRERIRKYA